MMVSPLSKLLLIPGLAVVLVSCNIGSEPRAVAVNNVMVQINDSLFYMGREFGNTVGNAVTSRNFSSLTPTRERFERFIDSSRQRLVTMKDVNGSERLRKSEIELLDVEKNMVVNDFTPFERLTSFATMQEVTSLFDKIKEDSKMETDKMGNFKREQKLYAKRNGFKLEPNAAERR